MVELKILNKTQQEQVAKLLSFYKYFYICNKCGSVYGTDFKETLHIICPICENEVNKKKAEKRRKK